jgi:hypothetical protein
VTSDGRNAAAPHPVDELATVVAAVTGWLRVVPAPGPGAPYRSLADLTDAARAPAVLDDWLARHTEAVTRACGPVPPVVPYVRVVENALSLVGTVVATAYVVLGRVPRLRGSTYRIGAAYPSPVEVALLDKGFWCLPDDAEADHRDATVVPSPADLGTVARQQVLELAGTVLAWQPDGVHLGHHQRWGLVTDGLDDAVWQAATWAGRRAESADLAAGLLGDLSGTTQYGFVDGLGRRQLGRVRVTCCYAFALPEGCAFTCFTCPRTTDDERAELARAWGPDGPRRGR